MILFTPAPLVLPRYSTRIELHRVALPPRAFQLLAKRDRSQRGNCSEPSTHRSGKTAITAQGRSRWLSTRSPCQTAAGGAATDESQSLHLQAVRESAREIGNSDLCETQDFTLEQSKHPSLGFRRLRSPQRHAKNGTKLEWRRGVSSPNPMLPHTADSSKTNRQMSCASSPNYTGPSSEIASPNIRYVAGHETSHSLKSNSRPGLNGGGAKEGSFAGNSCSPLSTRSFCIPCSTPSLPVNYALSAEKEGQTRSVHLILDSDQQARSMMPVPPAPSRVKSVDSATAPRIRRCMRRVLQAAVIVTATDIRDLHNPWRGATVSSFTTVTLNPEVIVSLNLKVPSATFDAIQTSRCFDVNMLKPNEMGATLASEFARGHSASPFSDPKSRASVGAWQRSEQVPQIFPPILSRARGERNPVAFRIPCTFIPEKTVRLGDHAVIFGIVKTVPDETYDRFVGPDDICLAYVDGCYGKIEPLPKQPQDSPKLNRLNLSPLQIHQRGKVQPPSSTAKRTISTGSLASVPLTGLSDGGSVGDGYLADHPGENGVQRLEAGETAKGRTRIKDVHVPIRLISVDLRFKKILQDGNVIKKPRLPIRPGFVEYPPFRKIWRDQSNSGRIMISELVGKQRTGKSVSRRMCAPPSPTNFNPMINKILVKKGDAWRDPSLSAGVNRMITKIRIRKCNTLGKLPLPKSPNQFQSNDSPTERSTDVQDLIKLLFYGSGFRIRKYISQWNSDEQANTPPQSHMSAALHQFLETSVRRHTTDVLDAQEELKEGYTPESKKRMVQEHRKLARLATREAMEKDINDVMNEIDEYFKTRSKGGAIETFDLEDVQAPEIANVQSMGPL